MTPKTLKQVYAEHSGKVSDKWSIYLGEYERIFRDYRHEAICLLEIGIQNGGSLEILAKYFTQAKLFVGSDIDKNCTSLVFDDNRISLVVGDANTDTAQKEILAAAPSFNIILDDGSHRSSDIINSFCRYFPMLQDGGVFVIEDMHCSYWKEFEGGLFDPYSSIAFFKKLADVINYESWGVAKKRTGILKGFFSKHDILLDEKILQHIHSIEFINSMCVIKKNEPSCNLLGPRVVTGLIEKVVQGNREFDSTFMIAPNQSENKRATGISPEDEILVRDMQISNLLQRQSLLSAAIMASQQESLTFGSISSRVLNRWLAKFSGAGPRQNHIALLLTAFVRALESSGFRATVKRTVRFLLKKIRFSHANLTSNDIGAADQPQLSQWFAAHEPSEAMLASQVTAAKGFHYSPLVSVVVPVYKVPRHVLDETIKSLESQSYSNWQACIVWADIEDRAGWEWLKTRTVLDQRFKIQLLIENGGISVNSDAALDLVDGEFIALLDHDDTLTPWAFFEVVSLLQLRPNLDFIYSDKDSMSADGRIRMNALFKPDWSPEMLHSVNYLTHLNVIRTTLVRTVGGWRRETDGAQDWDLFFRITERTKNIARVASILYHWRILPTSTASGLHAKPYAALAQMKTQQDYFTRRGLAAAVVPTAEGMFKVCWLVRQKSIDVVVYQAGTFAQLKKILAELMLDKQPAIRRIHVVYSGDASTNLGFVHTSWEDRVIFVHRDTVNWHSALESAISIGIPEAQTILLINGGATGVSPDLVEELGSWVTEHPDIAWVSAVALDKDEIVYEAGRVVSLDGQSAPLFAGSPLYSFGWFGGPLWYRNASACSPHAVAMGAADVGRVLSNLDKQSIVLFSAFCQQLAGERSRGLINPFARVYFEHAPEKNWVNEGKTFHSDPYFNPAFSQVSPLRLHP
jgi:glycosyltransferase involved in cell wall biosynthesis